AVSNRRPLIEFAKEAGHPDGMTIDEEGRLWVAFWGGFAVRCVDPKEARVIQTIDVPAPQVTSCAFGGPALDVLYITTAAVGLSEEKLQAHPHSGGVFQVRPGARGVPAFAYGG